MTEYFSLEDPKPIQKLRWHPGGGGYGSAYGWSVDVVPLRSIGVAVIEGLTEFPDGMPLRELLVWQRRLFAFLRDRGFRQVCRLRIDPCRLKVYDLVTRAGPS